MADAAAPSNVEPTPTAADINAAADAAVKSGTAVSMGAAAGVIVDPPKSRPTDSRSIDERLDTLEDELAKLQSDVSSLFGAVAHVVSDEFKAVWAKVVNFMPFKVK